MAKLVQLLLCSVILGLVVSEPEYCKKGMRISELYQHCFEEAHFKFPFQPLHEHHDIIDGCMVEAYARHTCTVVKPAALECFVKSVKDCDDHDNILAIADESGGACYGNHLSREFKDHVLNLLEPVRGDSRCFILGDTAYECYSQAGVEMTESHPHLELLTIDEYMPVANNFFDSIYNCFIAVYQSNVPICENWQIPLLLELQGTALPSLFGMTFSAEQMDKLELNRGCPQHHYGGMRPPVRNCVSPPNDDDDSNSNNDKPEDSDDYPWGEDSKEEDEEADNNLEDDTNDGQEQEQQQQSLEDNTLPPFLQQQLLQQTLLEDNTLPPFLQQELQQLHQTLEENTLPPFLQRLREQQQRQE